MESEPAATIMLLLLVLIDVIYYGFASALDQLNEKEIAESAEEKGDRRSKRLLQILNFSAIYVNTFHLMVTMVHILIGWFYMDKWVGMVENGLVYLVENVFSWTIAPAILSIIAVVITFALVLYILLTFGVLLPRKFVLGNPKRWAYALVDLIYVISRILAPFTGLIYWTTKGVLYLFGLNGLKDEADVTEEEIINMVNEGHEQGLIQASEAEMISNIFEYHDKEAQDIMTNRTNIIALESDMLLKDAIEFVLNNKQSRYPVYEENIDHIIGILHLKDVLRYHAQDDKLDNPISSVEDLLREPEYVPLTRNIDELFKVMQSKKLQMVIVVDEYGQTAGLVAMEDILEEIVGNIMDEYDEDMEYIEDKGNDEYEIEGLTPLEELEERFGISFENSEFETLNGFLISKLDRIPEENEEFEVEVEDYLFKILSVSNKMIQKVLVVKLPEEMPEGETENLLEEKQD